MAAALLPLAWSGNRSFSIISPNPGLRRLLPLPLLPQQAWLTRFLPSPAAVRPQPAVRSLLQRAAGAQQLAQVGQWAVAFQDNFFFHCMKLSWYQRHRDLLRILKKNLHPTLIAL